jgi:serine protease Do
MRKHVLISIAILPLLLGISPAAQCWSCWTRDADQPFGISSEDSGSNSYLGVDIADITSDRLGALKLKEEKGVEVTMVDQDAPAGKAGVKDHDVILSMNGTAVESKSQLQRMIHETPPGRVVTLGLSRDGQPMTIKVQLADRRKEWPHVARSKDDFHFEMPEIPPIPPVPDFDVPNINVVVVHSSMRSGLMVENLTQQLGEFFGAKNGQGVLVRSVEKGSRADKAGLRAGDVIIRVADEPIHDGSDFTHALHGHNSGPVSISVIRDRKEQTFTLTLPQHKDSGDLLEESVYIPDLRAETRAELRKVQNEMAKMQPQLELAKQEARKASEEFRKSICAQQKNLLEQNRIMKENIQPQIQMELEKSRQKLQQEIQQLEKGFTASFDI